MLGKKLDIQVESVEHIEQYHIKFLETSHYLKRRGRKAFVESLFLQSNGFACTLSPISFFPSDKIFQFSFKLCPGTVGHHARLKENERIFCF